jgi:hypothetical protein
MLSPGGRRARDGLPRPLGRTHGGIVANPATGCHPLATVVKREVPTALVVQGTPQFMYIWVIRSDMDVPAGSFVEAMSKSWRYWDSGNAKQGNPSQHFDADIPGKYTTSQGRRYVMSFNSRSTAESLPHKRGALRTAAMVTLAVSLAAVGIPVMGGPAQAVESANAGPCTITAVQPEDRGEETVSGKSIIVYPIKAECSAGGVKVHIKQEVAEEDNGSDDTLETFWHVMDFREAGTQYIDQKQWLHNTEGGAEESYHRVEFRVETDQGVWSEKHKVQSPTRSFRY